MVEVACFSLFVTPRLRGGAGAEIAAHFIVLMFLLWHTDTHHQRPVAMLLFALVVVVISVG